MDIKYMQVRFERGREWIKQFMEKKHKYSTCGLSNAHADFLKWQHEEGNGRG